MDKSWYLLLHSTTWLPIPATVATLSMEHRQGLVRLVECGIIQSQPVRVSKLSFTYLIIHTHSEIFLQGDGLGTNAGAIVGGVIVALIAIAGIVVGVVIIVFFVRSEFICC